MTSSPTGSSSIQNIQDDHQKKAAAIGDAGNQKQKLRSANLLQHVDHETPSPHTMEEERKHAVSFVLTFTNLTYRARVRREMLGCGCKSALPVTTMDISGKPAAKSACTKMLLNGICGKAREGEILAVMGASGSGKSTLIDALAKRISKESLQGSVKLNGEVIDGRLMRSISAYVRQEDLLFPMLTVEETLSFAAEFRLPRTVSREKKQARVQALIEQLGLRRAAKTIIGDEGHRGVSGGERRRVSIGIDIVHDPILLFLDEPTSGLDSTCAFMVVKVLQRIAQTGSIVILSIHQPSFRIVSLLDRMIFLSNGNTVYNGPSAHLPAYLADFGRPVPENENPTEFALDLIRELEVSRDGAKNLVDFYNSYKSTRLISSSSSRTDNKGLTLKDAINASVSRGKLVFGNGNDDRSSSEPMQEFANPLWKETAILTKRSVMNTRRLPELFFTRLGIIMVTGFILSTIFCRLDSSPKGVKERLGFLAFAISTTFYTCADALPVFLQERYIFMRETAYNAYRRSSYVISNAIVAAPPLVLLSLVFAAITFFAVGLAGGRDGFVYFFAITFASFWAGSGFVTFISGIISQVMVGYIVAIAAISYCLLFSGFFINRDRIPPYWIWFHYLSMVKYPYEGVLLNEFENAKQCFATGSQMFDVTPLKGLSEERKAGLVKALSNSLGINITLTTCVTTGSDILKEQSITQLSKWNCFWVTMAIGFFFRVLFYVALLIGSKNKRR